MTPRKEIKDILNNPYYSDDDDARDQICSLMKERLEKLRDDWLMLEPLEFEKKIDQLIKELSDGSDHSSK